jgi:transcriptional regulator GlxA family with amidase domain
VFSEANRYGAHYEVVTYSRDGRPVRSSTGIQLAVDAAADTATPKVSVRTSASGLASLIGSPLHGPTSSRIRSSA